MRVGVTKSVTQLQRRVVSFTPLIAIGVEKGGLKAKGKNGKLALAAVGNKLIKQCVAIAKSELPYNEKYFIEKTCF